MNHEALKLLREADWDRITLLLTKYALFKVRRLEWRTGDFLPKGLLPEDVALEAIRKTFEGIRVWSPMKEPDVLEFLKGVVDSDVNALVESAEHRMTSYSADLTLEMHSGLGAEQALILREKTVSEEKRLKTLLDELYVACVDDEEELLVLLAFQEAAKRHDKVKPSLVAKYAGLEERSVRNAMRRLTRKVERKRFHE